MNVQNLNAIPSEGVDHRYGRRFMQILGALMIISILITSIGFISPPENVAAAPEAPTGPWTLYTVDSPPLFYNMTDRYLHYRPDGTPCAAYGGDHLYYACYNETTGGWDEVVVDNARMVGAYAALTYNSLGDAFISYYDAEHGFLKLAYKIGANPWGNIVMDTGLMAANRERQTPDISPELKKLFEIIDLRPWRDPLLFDLEANAPEYAEGPMGVGKYSSLTFDSDDRLHISYHDEINGALKYIFWDGFNPPTIETVDDYSDQGDTGLYTSISTVRVFDRQWVWISYLNEKYDDLRVTRRRGSASQDAWRFWDVDGTNMTNVGTFSSMVIVPSTDPNRPLPVIAYLDFSNYNLKVAKLNLDYSSWSKTAVDSQGDVGLYCSLAKDSDNNLYISYYDLTNGDLKFAKYVNGSWTVKKVYDVGNLGFTSIATHPTGGVAGKLGIAYFNMSLGILQFTRFSSTDNTWKGSTIQYASDVGQSTSLALNNIGIPFISYMNDTRDLLKYAQYFGTYWYKTYITSTVGVGPFSAIGLRSDYDPVVALYEQKHHDTWVADMGFKGWEYSRVAHTNDVGQYVSMAVDSLGYPRLSYYDATRGELDYAWWDIGASKWVTDTADYIDGDVGMFTSLVLDAADRPYISYFDYTHETIKLALKSIFGSWIHLTVAQVGDPNDDVQVTEAYSAVGIDSTLTPHVAYYVDTGGDLMFADWNGANFNYTALDTGGIVGKYVSMVINPATDERHLCYYDQTNGNLKYAYWNGGWSPPENVDTLGDVGMFCDIAIDGAGIPGISYYDASMGDLKYASLAGSLPDPFFRVFAPLLRR
jgi:hypothetical protein